MGAGLSQRASDAAEPAELSRANARNSPRRSAPRVHVGRAQTYKSMFTRAVRFAGRRLATWLKLSLRLTGIRDVPGIVDSAAGSTGSSFGIGYGDCDYDASEARWIGAKRPLLGVELSGR